MRVLAAGGSDDDYLLVLGVLMTFAPDTTLLTDDKTIQRVGERLGYTVLGADRAIAGYHLALLFPKASRSLRRKARKLTPTLEVK